MENWFTVEPIDSDTFIISEYKHWEETHCYLLCGTKKALLIDTGLGIENIKKVVENLTALPVSVLTTHAHWDHIGGHKYFDDIAVHEAEKDWLFVKFPIPRQTVIEALTKVPCPFPSGFNIEKYRIFQGFPKKLLHDKERIDIGGWVIEAIHTPGHSPGHCCFYEPKRKYLYSGDLIYSGCLDIFYPTTNPQQFRDSVKRIRALEINRLFPGHHSLKISPKIIERIGDAFDMLYENELLHQGNGIFKYDDFQIHL